MEVSEERETDSLAANRAGIWSNRDFVKLWLGQTVSRFGTHITDAAIAATAALIMRATPAQMGVLGAVEGVAVLMFGLIAGAWVDRLRRRPILMATDIGRALTLATIPLAWMMNALTMGHLWVAAGLVGVMTVFYNVADRAALPALVSRAHLVEANSKLSASESVAEIGGQALGGTLVQLISAPLTIFVDTLSYLFSALCIGLIRKPEPAPRPSEERQHLRLEIMDGLRTVAHQPTLRVLAGSSAVTSFFGSFIGALCWIYLIRELKMTPAFVGLWVGVGGIGSLIGALLASRITRRFGLGPSLVGASLYAALVSVYLPLIDGPRLMVAVVLLLGQLINDVAWPIHQINAMTLRQTAVPDHLLGRANAGMDMLQQAASPLGALMGGVLGSLIGMRGTLWIAWMGIMSAALWLYFSPVRSLRHPPSADL